MPESFLVELLEGSISGLVHTNTPRKVALANYVMNTEHVVKAWNQSGGIGFIVDDTPTQDAIKLITHECAVFFGWNVTPLPQWLDVRAVLTGGEVIHGKRNFDTFHTDGMLTALPLDSVVAWI